MEDFDDEDSFPSLPPSQAYGSPKGNRLNCDDSSLVSASTISIGEDEARKQSEEADVCAGERVFHTLQTRSMGTRPI